MLPWCKLIIPHVYLENIYSIDIEGLKEKKNIKGLIVDLDNTIVPWGDKYLDERILFWIEQVKRSRIKICLVSNTHNNISDIGGKLGIPYFYSRYKPMKKPFLQAMKVMNTDHRETAVVGDQLFTDVLGGNRLQLLTILVCPLSQSDSLGTTIVNRALEHFIISYWLKSGKIKLVKGKWPT